MSGLCVCAAGCSHSRVRRVSGGLCSQHGGLIYVVNDGSAATLTDVSISNVQVEAASGYVVRGSLK